MINKVKNIKITINIKAFPVIVKKTFLAAFRLLKVFLRLIGSIPSRLSLIFSNIKAFFLVRSFWGRTNFYTRYFQAIIIFLTIALFLTGVFTKLTAVGDTNLSVDTFASISNGNIDVAQQGVGIQTIVANSGLNFKYTQYITQTTDNLESIANAFEVSKDTIKWANQSVINYFSETFSSGATLFIPEINGVLYEVQAGDNVDSVVAKAHGDKFQVIEINQLVAPAFTLSPGARILIPNGQLDAPPPPAPPTPIYYYTGPPVDVSALGGISFINPMGSCGGYIISQPFWAGHNGVDLAGSYGCPIVAAADGVVDYVGWSNYGEGNMVRIYHGNGVYTSYYHGSGYGNISAGQHVGAGEVILYVGTTGYATGPHLHFGLRLGANNFIDPRPYVPY
ncbi:MAG: M23 family metallopeptidase [Candidatus Dojkabacteria bacterium]